MAARSDAATDRVTLASAPSMATITICGWAKVVNAAASSFNPIVRFYTNSGDTSSWIVGFKGANGRTPSVYSPSSTTGISAPEVAAGTYIFVCATLSGTAAQLLYGTTPGSLTKVTGTVAASGTPDRLTFFGRSAADGSEWLDGSLAYWRVWLSVLSDAEAAAESQSTTPVKASPWASWAFAAAALTDASGNSRNLTAGTTALASDTDPSLSTTITGTGSATAPTAAAAGAGTVQVSGSGSATVATAQAAGAGTLAATGTGSATAPTAVAAGAGTVRVTGTGSATAAPATSAGAATVTVAGTGQATASPAIAAGTGSVIVVGTGSASAPPASVSGTGSLNTATIDGSGNLIAAGAIITGTGAIIITGTGSAIAPAAVVHGAEQAAEVPAATDPRLIVRSNLAVLSARPNGALLTVTANRAVLTLGEP